METAHTGSARQLNKMFMKRSQSFECQVINMIRESLLGVGRDENNRICVIDTMLTSPSSLQVKDWPE